MQAAVRAILDALGEDASREGLRRTPERVAEMFAEVLDGIGRDPAEVLATPFREEHYEGAVVVRDIPFYSLCEHHMLPFYGHAHIGYIPCGKLAGASKLARALDVVAHRLQLQERMTEQLGDAIMKALEPDGAVVVIEAEHLCMVMRGARKQGSRVVTSVVRGPFGKGDKGREELFSLVRGQE
jgi:GTP cyclohydrolase I